MTVLLFNGGFFSLLYASSFPTMVFSYSKQGDYFLWNGQKNSVEKYYPVVPTSDAEDDEKKRRKKKEATFEKNSTFQTGHW